MPAAPHRADQSSSPAAMQDLRDVSDWPTVDQATLRRVQLHLLDTFVAFCEANQLTYSLAAGTLLGAVRHGGFIPWDDDLDVMMPRADYEMLLSKAEELETGSGVRLAHDDASYPYPFAKLMQPETLVHEALGVGGNLGIYIDIFPVDIWPKGRRSRALLRAYVHGLGHVIRIHGWSRAHEGRVLAVALRVLRLILAVVPTSAARRAITRAATRSTRNSEFGGIIVWGYHEQFAVADFLPTEAVEFEGRRVRGPRRTHEVLSSIYGDYMKPPPEDQRVAPHGVSAHVSPASPFARRGGSGDA